MSETERLRRQMTWQAIAAPVVVVLGFVVGLVWSGNEGRTAPILISLIGGVAVTSVLFDAWHRTSAHALWRGPVQAAVTVGVAAGTAGIAGPLGVPALALVLTAAATVGGTALAVLATSPRTALALLTGRPAPGGAPVSPTIDVPARGPVSGPVLDAGPPPPRPGPAATPDRGHGPVD